LCGSIFAGAIEAHAESLKSALARAYRENPDLNQSRASVRVQDEEAPKALAGKRPKASIQATAGWQVGAIKIPAGRSATGQRQSVDDAFSSYPRGATLAVSQTLFDGGRTESAFRQAESNVFAARSTLRLTEQAVLQNGAAAYMNVLRDAAIRNLRKNNISVLEQQLRVTADRFGVGAVTQTDVAQAQASLAQARSQLYGAEAQLKTSVAAYRQIIGDEPRRLEPGRSVEPLLPKSQNQAIDIALAEHPGVTAALHQVDAAEQAVKTAESALSPTLSVGAQLTNQRDAVLGVPGTRQFAGAVIGQLNVPLYQGGAEYASIRQAKEQLGQVRLNADLQRDSVRASVVSSYGLLETAKASLTSWRAAEKAAETALIGVRDEAKAGARTTLDVLNAQQALLNARAAIVVTQRDLVVASYAVLGSIGRLSADTLDLDVTIYDPSLHYDQVKTQWFGVETPDGR
jgi:outer membrane protein